jgi:pimeloyl-ACP methyl ester carboxylesterase
MEVKVQGHPVYVTHKGTGTPALFLHGVPDTAELWDAAIAGVADRYACYAPDFQGIHRSAINPAFDYSFDGYADWVEALVTALDIHQPITLVAHDWGGLIGAAWASKYPQRIARIVLMNTAFTPRYRWHAWARAWRTPVLGELSMWLMSRTMLSRELRRGSRKLSAAQIHAIWCGAPSKMSARMTILKLYRSANPEQLVSWESRWQQLTERVPVKILWGAHDPYLPRWVASSFNTQDIEIIEGSGHWVPAEAPERLIAALKQMAATP